METTELLAALAAKARSLRQKPITQRDLRAWVDRGLVAPAKPKGQRRGVSPIWEYAAGSVDAANLIVELRALGVTRTSALRLHLWANGFDFGESELRSDLQSELKRLLRRRHREEYWDSYGKQIDELTKHQRTALRTQLKKRDPRLAAIGPELTDTLLLDAISAMHWPEHLPETVTDSLPELVRTFLTSGLLANPEYTSRSALELLVFAQQSNFSNARNRIREYCFNAAFSISMSGSSAISCNQILHSLTHGDWLIFAIAAMVTDEIRERRAMKSSG